MTKLVSFPARYEQLCACGRLILPGDEVAAISSQDGRQLWVHVACARLALRSQGLPVHIVPGRARADVTRDDAAAMATHRQVNGSHERCARCGRRLILGRDDAPVRTRDGRRWVHRRCDTPTS